LKKGRGKTKVSGHKREKTEIAKNREMETTKRGRETNLDGQKKDQNPSSNNQGKKKKKRAKMCPM